MCLINDNCKNLNCCRTMCCVVCKFLCDLQFNMQYDKSYREHVIITIITAIVRPAAVGYAISYKKMVVLKSHLTLFTI